MKLCITSKGKKIGATIDTTFGRAPYFFIVDTGTDAMEVLENTATPHGQGAGIAAAQFVSDRGVEGVLTGYVGPNARNALKASGIKVFEGLSGQETVEEAIARFKEGEYREAPEQPASPARCRPGRGRGFGRGKGWGRGRCS
jgi:predicted Fe-Mo cluster-binding NifX family protein